MIKPKQKVEFICAFCNKKYVKWQGKCDACHVWNCLEEKEVIKKTYSLPKISLKRKEQNKQPDLHQEELDKWFDMQRNLAISSGGKCQNCGCSIMNDLQSQETWIWRRVLCHVIAKSKYPSISTHPLNCIFMCWSDHASYDSTWSKARQMDIWGLAIKKAKKIVPLIKESVGKLPTEFVD